ncbi:MAG: hypothetical protein WCC61_12595, partial [Pseudomonas sp.]|uniref:hypothetical protein n=1 Tax=Pseudomonas sp. TaxID=306 RepID=UPI003C7D6357
SANLAMTLAGAFFSKRARTSAHIVWGSLNEISEDFTEDLERDGFYSESPFPNAEKVTQKALPRRTALR